MQATQTPGNQGAIGGDQLDDPDQKSNTIPNMQVPERIPNYLVRVPPVIRYDFGWLKELEARLSGANELFEMINLTISYIEQSSLDQADKELVTTKLREELEVLSYSNNSRSSVIAF